MGKEVIENMSLKTATKIIETTQKEIQSLKNDKNRLIKERDDLQGEVNVLADKASNIKKTLQKKEDELMEKIQLKEDELDRKIREKNVLTSELAAKVKEAKDAIALNKQAEISCKAQQDKARANTETAAVLIKKLKGIMNYVKEVIESL